MPEYHPSLTVHGAAAGDGGMVLLDTRSGMMFRLNPTGAIVWHALHRNGGSLPLVARVVAQRYGLPVHRVVPGIRRLVVQLATAGLLERAP
jgi:hypothetical protein